MVAKAKNLKSIARKLDVTAFLDYRNYLATLYAEAKAELEPYSYLQLAEDLGFSRSNVLFLVIKGKRRLSPASAKKIVKALGLKARKQIYFEKLVQYQLTQDQRERDDLFDHLVHLKKMSAANSLDRSTLEFFNQWYHSVIYEMTFADDFPDSIEGIAERLHFALKPSEIKLSLELLEELNLIEYDKADKPRPTSVRISTPTEIESLAIVRYHQKMIQLGRESITKISEDLRDVTALTMSLNDEQIPELKRAIAMFRDRILAMVEEDRSKNVVYQLNVQLFPVTKKQRQAE